MGRRPCCAKQGLNRGAWSACEDKILTNYIQIHGEGKWSDLTKKAGLMRCWKSCRLRWLNYLRPDINRGNISTEEDDLIIRLHKLLGNRWSLIARRLPGRTDNEIKNYWNTNLRKRVGENKIQNMQGQKSEKMRHATNSSMKFNSGGTTEESHRDRDRVIRTKAARCTKVVIPRLLDSNALENVASETASTPSVIKELDNSAGFLMDFDISELLISEDLSSAGSFQAKQMDEHGDFNVFHGNYGLENMPNCCTTTECANHDSTVSQELNFDDLMDETRPQQYTRAGDLFQTSNGILDLKSLALFSNSEDDQWINWEKAS